MVVPPDDGPRYTRNMERLTKYTKNKLCIKLVFLYVILQYVGNNLPDYVTLHHRKFEYLQTLEYGTHILCYLYKLYSTENISLHDHNLSIFSTSFP
jgi:hypothetical protein